MSALRNVIHLGRILAHLRIERSQCIDLVRAAVEDVGSFEVFVASGAPEEAGNINDQRVTNTATKDHGAIGALVHLASPRALLGVRRHECFDFADEPGKESSALRGG